MFHKLSAALLVLCLLTSCGGGGGGGGGSSSGSSGGGSGIRFTADRTQVDLAYDEGAGFTPTGAVTVTATGTFSGTLYVGAVVEGNGIDPNVQMSIAGTQATFSFTARSGLAPGTYTGRVSLMGCRDQNCNNQIGNSPVIVNYSVLVRARLRVTPESVTAASTSGTATSVDVTIGLPTGATSFTPTVSYGSEWISVEAVSSTLLRIRLRSLPSQQFAYTGTVRVAAGTSELSIPVNYNVTGGVPATYMSVSPTSLTLTGTEGALSAPVMLNVTPPSWDTSATTVRFITYGGGTIPWLSGTAVTGGHRITADATDLAAGSYQAFIAVNGGYPQQEIQVPVALTVGEGLVRPADVIKNIESDTTTAALSGTVPINVVTGPAVGWTATASSAPWFTLTDASGTTGETLAYQINNTLLQGLANGAEYPVQITVTPARASMTPVTFDIRVRKRLAAVTHVGPALQFTTRPARIILRGYGFDGVANLAARLQSSSIPIQSVTRVNDTEVIVNTGTLTTAGSALFSFNNVLGHSVSSGRLYIIAPSNYAISSAATGGPLRGLFFDQQRNNVYAVNTSLEALQRFRIATAPIEVTSLPVPSILSAGMTQDGTRLMVASAPAGTTSTIRLLDPADMNVQISTHSVGNLARTFDYLTGVLQNTNDGRTWLQREYSYSELPYFVAATGETGSLPMNNSSLYFSGVWYAVSRDGERLIMPTSNSSTPLLYMDAADSVPRVNPASIQLAYRMSISDDGNRFLYENYEVRDRDFALIGRINQLPQLQGEIPYFPVAAQLSPDGNRVYAVSYPNNWYSGQPARVYVLDSSTRSNTTDDLPVLGYTNLSDYPSCFESNQYPPQCVSVIHTVISPDGLTLFAAGDRRLLVLPTSGLGLTPIVTAPPPRVQKAGRGATMPWPLDLRQ